MPRVAILGGGIAGLAAAYECEQQRLAGKALDWHLFEASARFGGTVQTTRLQGPDGEYILEDGPDSWVTEKPWAATLATELGLGDEIIPCNEAGKRTYIVLGDELVPMPARMRLMVPEDLAALDASPLFTEGAKAAYRAELEGAEALKAAAPASDESVASFVQRHFGSEVLAKIGAPLLSGVFGGDVHRLSVQAVMPAFVQMERDYGSLIAAVQARAQARGSAPPSPTFTSLKRGMASLVEALLAALPPDRLHPGHSAASLGRSGRGEWMVRFTGPGSASCAIGFVPFDEILSALPATAVRSLLHNVDEDTGALIPNEASSALLVTLCWPATIANFDLPPGFGFLVPQAPQTPHRMLAGTFSAQKFPDRAPEGARVVRAFFSGTAAQRLAASTDETCVATAFHELRRLLPTLPTPALQLTTVRRWPQSLPQYAVGHRERMAELGSRVAALGHLHLLGNSYHGVGVPDLIRDARAAVRELQ